MTSYARVHARLAKVKGSAKSYPCSGCGKPAAQWAYIGPRVGGERRPFSTDLSMYVPMCVGCHTEHDRTFIAVADKHPGDATLF